MAIVHDLAEAETGDFVTRDVDGKQQVENEEKEVLEQEAIASITGELDTDIQELWQEYEERETGEAKFVKDMDLIDMCLQALKYERQERYDPEEDNEDFQEYDNLDEFFATTEPRLNMETGKQLFEDVRERYEEAKQQPPK
jgi:putative hydrolase of HD superfamily